MVFGQRAAFISEPRNDTEWQTRLDGVLMAGQEFCVIDNIVNRLNSHELASVLTSRERTCRILQTSNLPIVPVNTVFSINGNSIEIGYDLEERVIMICLSCKDATSRDQSGFEIQKQYNQSPDVFVEQRRPEFLQHLINLVCAWKNAGAPRRQKLLMSKYGAWESIIGGIFDFVTPTAKFLATNQAKRSSANAEETEMIAFIEAIIRQFPGCDTTPITVAGILQATRDDDSDIRIHLPDALRTSPYDSYFPNRIGKLLKNYSTRSVDGYEVQIGTDREHKNNYLIVDTKPERHPHMHQPQQQITTQRPSEVEQWLAKR
jgi:hypothetical protein